MNEQAGFGTRAIHAGQSPDPTTGAIMTPVYLTSTYVQEAPGVFKGYDYSRTRNPTRSALEANLAALEGGRHGLCFSSGMAAIAGGVVGYFALAESRAFVPYVLMIAAASFVYVALADLVPDLHRSERHRGQWLSQFLLMMVGVAIIALVTGNLHAHGH